MLHKFHFHQIFKVSFIGVVGGALVACGGSDDETDSSYTSSYLQFYNASPNGASVTMREEEGDTYGTAQFGDVTSLYSLASGDYSLEFVRTDADDQEVLVQTWSTSLQDGNKKLITVSGDFSSPRFNEYEYTREDLDNHFRLMAMSMTEQDSRYDIYLSNSGEPFEAANFLGTLEHEVITEFEFWDTDEDSVHFNEGEYTVYLTLPGEEEVVFESSTYNFQYETEYVLAVRDVSGAIQTGVVIDVIINSSAADTLTDVNASSQYRVFNTTNIETPLAVTLRGNQDTTPLTISAGEISDFTAIDFGDYQLTVTSSQEVGSLTNQLVTLNQGESKAIVLYSDAGNIRASTFIESGLSQAYDKTINIVNTVSDYDALDIYLVRKDETVDTAEYRVANIEFGETKSETVPADYYEIIAIYEENDERILLNRTELIGLNEDANYIISIEPTDSENVYEIVISH